MKTPLLHQIVHGTCADLSSEGKGVLRHGKDVVFVDNMFPGEEGDVEVLFAKGDFYFGKIKKLCKISKNRVEPRCKICSSCGGCEFQQLAYSAQLQWKTSKVKEQFRKIAKIDLEVLPTLGMEEPYFYRNKIQMPFGVDQKGNVYCGFYKRNTHVIVPVERCYLEDERAEHILSVLKKLMKAHRVAPYDEDSRKGVLRHALIRTSHYQKQIMLVLVTNVDSFPGRNNFVKAIVSACPEITTVVQNINTRATNVILGDRERILYGKGYIEDSLCGVQFKISAKSFYQTNPVMTELLYSKAMEAAELKEDDVVFDAYSGIGTIGLIASRSVRKVLSVELVKEAVVDGKENAKRNGIDNFFMYCDDASTFMVRMAEENRHVDVLFMDPPRKGSDERFLKALLKLKPSRVVYVSCDPSTLARDIAYIKDTYEVKSVQPVDMFSHTTHVETVASLELKQKAR